MAAIREERQGLGIGRINPTGVGIPDLPLQLLGQYTDVVALVAVLGHRRLQAEQRAISGRHRRTEQFHLAAVVIHVELAGHIVAGVFENARNTVAVRGLTGMAHVWRPSGVGRHELDENALSRAGLPAAIAIPRCDNRPCRGGEPPRAQREVDESGSGHLGRFHKSSEFGIGGNAAHELFGDIAWASPGGLREGHCHVGREVPETGIAGRIEAGAGGGAPGHRRCLAGQRLRKRCDWAIGRHGARS